jgi:copper(I)-binding protein
MKRALTLLPIFAVSALALAACGSDGGGVEIDGVWARTSPSATDRGAVYFEITADDDDTLVGVSVDPSIAGTAEIHEMVMADMGDEMSGDMSDDGEMSDDMSDEMSDDMSDEMSDDMGDDMSEMPMTMQEMTAGLPLPAGETVVLEPGSYHVMLIDLVEPLETGQEFELTLDFENADEMTIDVEVMESAP